MVDQASKSIGKSSTIALPNPISIRVNSDNTLSFGNLVSLLTNGRLIDGYILIR